MAPGVFSGPPLPTSTSCSPNQTNLIPFFRGVGTSQLHPISTKAEFSSHLQMEYEDYSTDDTYAVHPNNCLPSNDHFQVYNPGEGIPRWSSLARHPTSQSVYMDQESIHPLGSVAPYLIAHQIPSRYAGAAVDVAPFTMTSLNTSLPSGHGDRLLPAPTTSRPQTAGGSDGSSIQAQDCKPRVMPTQSERSLYECGWTEANQRFGGIANNDSRHFHALKPLTIPSSVQEQTYGYLPLNNALPSPEHSPNDISPTSYRLAQQSSPTIVNSSYSSPTGLTTHSDNSDVPLTRHESSASLYSYSADPASSTSSSSSTCSSSKREGMLSGMQATGILVSGHAYTPLSHPQPVHTLPLRGFHTGAAERETIQRESMGCSATVEQAR